MFNNLSDTDTKILNSFVSNYNNKPIPNQFRQEFNVGIEL